MAILNADILKDTRTLIGMYQKNPAFRERLDSYLKKDTRIVFKRRPIKLYLEVLGSLQTPNNYKFKHFYKEALKIKLGDSEGIIGKALGLVTSSDMIHLDSAITRTIRHEKALDYDDEEIEKINEAEKSPSKEKAHKERLEKTDYLKKDETPQEKKKAEEQIAEDERKKRAEGQAGESPEHKKSYQPSSPEDKARLEKILNKPKEEVPQNVLVDLQGRPLISKPVEESQPTVPQQPSAPQFPSISEARDYYSKFERAREFFSRPSWGKFKAIFTGGGAEGVVIKKTITAGAEKVAGGFAARITATRTVLATAGKAMAVKTGQLAASALTKIGLKVIASAVGATLTGGISLAIQFVVMIVLDPKGFANLVKNLFKWIALIVIGIFFLLFFSTNNYRGITMSSIIPPYPLTGTPIAGGRPGVSPGPYLDFEIKKAGPAFVDNGQDFSFVLEVINKGTRNLSFTLTDPLSDKLEYLGCSDSCNTSGQNVIWNLPNILPLTTKRVTVTVRPKVTDDYVWNFADTGVVSGRSNNWLVKIGSPTAPPPSPPTPTPTINPNLKGGCPDSASLNQNSKEGSCQYLNPAIDIFQTSISDSAKEGYITKYSPTFINAGIGDLNEFRRRVDYIILQSQSVGLNPAILLGYWKTESLFSTYPNVADLGCDPSSPSAKGFENQVKCALGIGFTNYVAGCARGDMSLCNTLKGMRTSYDLTHPISYPIKTFDDWMEAYGPYDHLNDQGLHSNCNHTYNVMLGVLLELGTCQPTPTITPPIPPYPSSSITPPPGCIASRGVTPPLNEYDYPRSNSYQGKVWPMTCGPTSGAMVLQSIGLNVSIEDVTNQWEPDGAWSGSAGFYASAIPNSINKRYPSLHAEYKTIKTVDQLKGFLQNSQNPIMISVYYDNNATGSGLDKKQTAGVSGNTPGGVSLTNSGPGHMIVVYQVCEDRVFINDPIFAEQYSIPTAQFNQAISFSSRGEAIVVYSK